MHRMTHGLSGLLRKLAAAALLGALVLDAGPARGQALRTPYAQPIETGSDTRHRGLQQAQQDLAEFVVGNILFVLLHEMAHVHVTEMGLPVLGREEDAADAFATLALIKMGSEFSHGVLTQAAKGWFLCAEHALDRQRAYQIVCLMIGSDPEKFGELADLVKMPEERQETCQGDYSNASYSWDLVLKPHRRAADQAKTIITTVHGEDKSGLDVNARSFRALRLLESVAERAAEQFVWRKPFTIELQSCGKPGAHWDLMSHRLTVCYEMAEEFVHLCHQQTLEPKPGPMAANEPIARNIKTQGASKASQDAAVAPGLTESGAKTPPVGGFEQLVGAMTAEIIEFFAPTTEPALAGSAPAVQLANR